jgi:hypothetical protein
VSRYREEHPSSAITSIGPPIFITGGADLDYRNLVRDGVTAITAAYEAASIEPSTDPTAFVEAYNAARPRDAHGTHRSSAADFGLDEAELRARFAFLDRSAHSLDGRARVG